MPGFRVGGTAYFWLRLSVLAVLLLAAGAARAYENGGYFVKNVGNAVVPNFPANANLYQHMVAVTFPVNSDPQLRALLANGFNPDANPQAAPQFLNANHNNLTFLYLPRTAFDLAFYVYRKGVAAVPPALGANDLQMYFAWRNGNGGPLVPTVAADLETYYGNLVNQAALQTEYENFNAWMINQIEAWVNSAHPLPGVAPPNHRLPWGGGGPTFVNGAAWHGNQHLLRFDLVTLNAVVTALSTAVGNMGANQHWSRDLWSANATPRILRLSALEDGNDGNTYLTRGINGGRLGANNPLIIRLNPQDLPNWLNGAQGDADYPAQTYTFSMSFSSGVFSACIPVAGSDANACTLGRLSVPPNTSQVFATPVALAAYRAGNAWSRTLYIPPISALASDLQTMQELWHPRTKIFVTGAPPTALNHAVGGIGEYSTKDILRNFDFVDLGFLRLPVNDQVQAQNWATDTQRQILQHAVDLQ